MKLHDGLMNAYDAGKAPFSNPDFIVAPETMAVAGITDDLQKANLLFNSIAVDRRNQSELAYPRFRRAYDADPRNVDPLFIASLTLPQAKDFFLERYRIGLNEVVEQAWQSNTIIAERHGGDPRKVFEGKDDVHEACRYISEKGKGKLPGFGEPMASLLIKNYIETALVQFSNPDEHPPKVDTWNTRISIATGVVTFDKEGWYHNGAIVNRLKEGWRGLARERKIRGRLLNNLIWAIGSKYCTRADMNVCYASGCPSFDDLCEKFPNSYDQDGQVYIGNDVRKPLRPPITYALLDEQLREQRVERGLLIITRRPTMPPNLQGKMF